MGSKQAHWMWDGIWTHHFMPAFDRESPLYYANLFDMGQSAMIRSMMWYTCCIENLDARWDLAVQPTYQGQIYAPMDVRSFYIPKRSKHPQEAFSVMRYLMEEAALDILTFYDAFPADPAFYEPVLARKAQQYPGVQNWEVAITRMAFAPTIHQELAFPYLGSRYEIVDDFLFKLRGTGGGQLDLDAELDQFAVELQSTVDHARSWGHSLLRPHSLLTGDD
jgi:multiple sugar transport system substrate-binding protein